MQIVRICPIGTSRLHRPLVKHFNGRVYDNRLDSIEVYFPKLGYFHSAAEAAQVLKLFSGLIIPGSMLKFCFRAEPTITTPMNEFRADLREAARNETEMDFSFNWQGNIDVFIIEVSTMLVNHHTSSGLELVSNPNLYLEASYKDIWRDGFYSIHAPDLGVIRYEMTETDLQQKFSEISMITANKPIIFMGHLNDPSASHAARKKLNDAVRTAAEKCGHTYFDTAPFVTSFGFGKLSNGETDIHHLTHEGEVEIGKALQQLCHSVHTKDR